STRVERVDDFGVGVEHTQPAEELHRVEEMPCRTDRRMDVEPVLDAGVEVVTAMAWGRVHDPCPLIECDVRTEHAERLAIVQRMPEPQALELLPCHAGQRPIEPGPDPRPAGS